MTDGVNASITASAASSLSSGTTTTSSDISAALKSQLEELGVNTTDITTAAEAKKAIAAAEAKAAESKAAEEKAAEAAKSKNVIKDTVDISKKALELNDLKSITT